MQISKKNYFSKNDIHLLGIDLNQYMSKTDELSILLSSNELERANRFHFEKDRAVYIIVRATLRKILGSCLEVDPKGIDFLYNEYGKPYLEIAKNPKNIQFNVSHTADMAVCIIGLNREVGIDIEKVRPMDNFEGIAEQFFAPKEYSTLKILPPEIKLNSFYKCWTRKEAFIKAVGNGLSYPLNEFEVTVDPKESTAIQTIKNCTESAKQWFLGSIDHLPGYEGAYAFKGSIGDIPFEWY